jgi:hypothetical protein
MRGHDAVSYGDQPDVAALAEQIRAYLLRHPKAADSVAGVLKWWLLEQRLEQSRDNVQRALDYLVATGQVAERKTPDGTVVYVASGDK